MEPQYNITDCKQRLEKFRSLRDSLDVGDHVKIISSSSQSTNYSERPLVKIAEMNDIKKEIMTHCKDYLETNPGVREELEKEDLV